MPEYIRWVNQGYEKKFFQTLPDKHCIILTNEMIQKNLEKNNLLYLYTVVLKCVVITKQQFVGIKTKFKDQTFKVWKDYLVKNFKPYFCVSNENAH